MSGAQWMGTNILKLENKQHSGNQFESSDDKGNVVFRANGVIHNLIPNQNITRTFEVENTPYGVQLEFLDFEKLAEDTSKLNLHMLYRSVTVRDQIRELLFAKGINMAHDRLQDILSKFKD